MKSCGDAFRASTSTDRMQWFRAVGLAAIAALVLAFLIMALAVGLAPLPA